MAKTLKVYVNPDPILRTKCREIQHMESWITDLAADMWQTMLTYRAVGLAANQVGFDYRMITVGSSTFQAVMINPVIEEKSDEIYHFAEGCLSVPGYGIDTGKRSRAIKVKYNDIAGMPQTIWLKDIDAVIVQHEIDHLDGVSMVDYVDRSLLK